MVLTALAGCQKPFEKHYDLSVDTEAYNIGFAGKTFPVYVYCSGEWTARIDAESDWVRLEGKTYGTGNGVVRVAVDANYEDINKEVNLVLESGSFAKTIRISQDSYDPQYRFEYEVKYMSVPAGSYWMTVSFVTNIPSEVLETSRPELEEGSAGISGITRYTILSDNGVMGVNRIVEGQYSFIVQKNQTGAERRIYLTPGVPAQYMDDTVSSLEVIQRKETASFEIEPISVSAQRQEGAIYVKTNLAIFLSDISISSSEDFVRKLQLVETAGEIILKYEVEANDTGNERTSDITLSYTDLAGTETTSVIELTQSK